MKTLKEQRDYLIMMVNNNDPSDGLKLVEKYKAFIPEANYQKVCIHLGAANEFHNAYMAISKKAYDLQDKELDNLAGDLLQEKVEHHRLEAYNLIRNL